MDAFRLPRLPTNWDKIPGLFGRYWDEVLRAVESAINNLLTLPIIEQALADVAAATAAAQSAANDAQTLVSAQAQESSIVASYVSSVATPVVSADSLGAVTVLTHTRVYGDPALNPSVSVVGGSISTSAVSGDTIRVYYTDPARTGGAVTYLYTVDPAPPMPQGGNVHSVGAVTIPAAGTADGEYLRPNGYIYF